MNALIVSHWLILAGCIWLIFSAFFDRKRKRARWAKLVVGTTGIIGFAYSVISLMLDARWLVLTGDNQYEVYMLLAHTRGLLLGFLLSVTIAGETRGIKTGVAPIVRTVSQGLFSSVWIQRLGGCEKQDWSAVWCGYKKFRCS